MDTILKPRYICSTATDESTSEEEDDTDVVHFDKKDSTCSSTITVIPNCASIRQVDMLEEKGNEDDDYDENEEEGSSGSKIICPTARFLQVNPKKVSSFDLLVRPPKRPRFINHPSREHIAHAAAFKQKTKPPIKLPSVPPVNPTAQVGPRKKSPILESIYFENEKLRYRQTMSGNWSSSSSSASPRNAKSHAPPNPMITHQKSEQLTSLYVNPESLPQKFSEEETLRDIELSDAYHQNVYAGDDGSDAGPAHMEEPTFRVQAEISPDESQDASSIFRTCYEDQSSTYNGHVILDEKTGEFRVIHHPDLRELHSESVTVLDGDSFLENMADKNENIGAFKKEEDDKHVKEDYQEYNAEERPISALLPIDSIDYLNGNRSSPLTIFLTSSMMGESGLDLGQDQDFHDLRFEIGSPFTNFGTEGEGDSDEVEGGLNGSRIEDVTDLVGDDEQVDRVIHLVRSGENGEGSHEMKTIFWADSAPGTSNSSGKMNRVTSEPCELMDGFKDKRKEKRKKTTTNSELNSVSQQSFDLQEEIDAQEFLLQPKPKLNLSSSVHSAYERGNVERTSTVAMFVEKKTKSDYFVGKIKGTSKTLLKPGFIYENSDNKIKSNLEFNEDSNIDITGDDDATDSQGQRPEEESQPNLQKSSSALAIAVVNAKRKVSTGNRVSNAVPDKTQKKKGMPPPPLRKQTANFATTSARRGEVQQLRFPRRLQRSSSSSSHQQILMTIKAKSSSYTRQKTRKNIENQKSILKKDKKPNFFMRIFGRLFGISTEKPKQSSYYNGRIYDDLIPSVPSSVIKRSDRAIVHHTDSKELYRERRRKFFKEQKEFRDESLSTYLEGMISHDNSSGAQDFVTIPPRIPLNYFLEREVTFPREAVEDAFNNNTNSSGKNSNEASTVPVPVRLAKSESALAGHSGGSGWGGRQSSIARANLVLQFPPFVQVLAAGMTRRRRSSLENKSDFKRVKEELKKPLRGILKNHQT